MEIISNWPWQVVIVLSGAMAGLSRLITKDQASRMGVFQMAFWQDLVAITILFVMMVLMGVTVSWWGAVMYVLYGLVLAIGVGAFNSAVRDDMTGATVMSYALSQIGIVIGAMILLSEWRYFDPTQIEGIKNIMMVGLGLTGLLMYGGMKLDVKWSRMIWLSVLINVGGNLFTKHLMNLQWDPVVMLFWQGVGMLIGNMVMMRRKRQKVVMKLVEVSKASLFALLRIGGLWSYLILMQSQPISILSITRRVAIIVVTLVIAWVVYGEHKRLSRKQWIGLLMGGAAFLLA